MRKLTNIIVLFALLLPVAVLAQFDIPKKPSLQTSIYDYANVLAANEKSALEQKLIQYSDTTSTQIVVITIESLKGESIGELTPKWAQEWGIGQSDKDNGVLILLAKAERKIWISPGYGLDDRLTAGELGEMTREVIIPEFKAGSYYSGLDKGTDAIFQMLNGKYKGEGKRADKKSSDDGPGGFIFIVIVIVILAAIFGRRGGGGRGGRGLTGSTLGDILILSSLGRGGRSSGGWGGSSGGGGGFGGGFGGGGFSGGGAGGSW